MDTRIGRIISGAYYDMQNIRISVMGRIRDIIRKKMEGIDFNQPEEKKEQDKIKRGQYTDDSLPHFLEILNKNNQLTEEEYKYIHYCLEIAQNSRSNENKYKNGLMNFIKNEPIYNFFLSRVRGIGPTLSANIIHNFGYCENYVYVSKLWAHSGLSVVAGVAQGRRKGQKANFDPKLKTLAWLIADCLVKQNRGYYRQIYDTHKEKHLNKEYKPGELNHRYPYTYSKDDTKVSKNHAHMRAMRYVAQRFLSHYWEASREYMGLSIEKHYVVDHLNHDASHIVSYKKALQIEN